MRILLAEDSALLREGLIALLERAGHDVVCAISTATELRAEALARIPDGDVDLLLTDVRMPPGNGDDGLRIALILREMYPDFPILVLSQYVEHRYAAQLLGLAPGERPTAVSRGVTASGGAGYVLKDRVAHVHDFLRALEAVHAGGIVMDPAVVSALMDQERSALDALSSREREVLALVSEGETNAQIGERLHLSQGAVVKHVSAVFDKLGISGAAGNHRVLAVLAHLRGTG